MQMPVDIPQNDSALRSPRAQALLRIAAIVLGIAACVLTFEAIASDSPAER